MHCQALSVPDTFVSSIPTYQGMPACHLESFELVFGTDHALDALTTLALRFVSMQNAGCRVPGVSFHVCGQC
jgi:hypothetical protein